MAEIIHHHINPLRHTNGEIDTVRTVGRRRADRMWEGWIEFAPTIDRARPTLVTDRETTQPDRGALEYWAQGLEPVYFQGAFDRARPSLPGS
jgi:hypothetical protein